jgi:hypothetical protein
MDENFEKLGHNFYWEGMKVEQLMKISETWPHSPSESIP